MDGMMLKRRKRDRVVCASQEGKLTRRASLVIGVLVYV
jgi:hypothetical protein